MLFTGKFIGNSYDVIDTNSNIILKWDDHVKVMLILEFYIINQNIYTNYNILYLTQILIK